MAKTISAVGTYNIPEGKPNAGQEVQYNFEYIVIDSIQDAIDELGQDKVKSCIQRMIKLDANNNAREKAKASNGHSARQPMSEEEKAQAKAKRQADKALLDLIKSKGLTAKDLASL